METIKEKAMRAWAQEKHVEIVTADKPDLNGVINILYPDHIHLRAQRDTRHQWTECYPWCNIVDIRFMDEPADEEAVIADEEDPRLSERQNIIESQRRTLSEEHGKVLDLMQQVGSLENQVLAMTRKETESKPISPDVAKERW